VKRSAQKAMYLCMAWKESKGMKRCRKVSRKKVNVLRLMVTTRLA
jgi:hypothetical protein